MGNLWSPNSLASGLVSKAVGPEAILKTATIALTVNPTVNDLLYFMRLPKCRIFDGFLRGSQIDSNATKTLKFDVGTVDGYAMASGQPSGGTVVQKSLHDDSAAITGAGVADHVVPDTAGAMFMHHMNKLIRNGDLVLTANESIVVATCTAIAATFAAGNLTVGVWYTETP